MRPAVRRHNDTLSLKTQRRSTHARPKRSLWHSLDLTVRPSVQRKSIASVQTFPVPTDCRHGRTLKQWKIATLAYSDSSGAYQPTEATNGVIEATCRIDRGFSKYRSRSLLAAVRRIKKTINRFGATFSPPALPLKFRQEPQPSKRASSNMEPFAPFRR